MKRSRKQAARERLTQHEVRHRQSRKRNEADRALWLAIGGQVAWQQELDRRRRARNERTREHTRQVVAAKKHAAQGLLWVEGAA